MRPCDVRVRLRQQFRLRPADWQVWAPSLVLLLRLQMTNAIFEFSVPVFERHLKILAKLLETAETHAKDRKFEPAALIFARLFPDMFALAAQVRADLRYGEALDRTFDRAGGAPISGY